jgi:hypothetical protein
MSEGLAHVDLLRRDGDGLVELVLGNDARVRQGVHDQHGQSVAGQLPAFIRHGVAAGPGIRRGGA